MAAFLPPLDFSLSRNSYSTAIEESDIEDTASSEWYDCDVTEDGETATLRSPSPRPSGIESEGASLRRPSWSTFASTVAPLADNSQGDETGRARRKLRKRSITQRMQEEERERREQAAEAERPFSRFIGREDEEKVETKATRRGGEGGGCFRCDVHATSSTDYTLTESQCIQLVLSAGGKIIDDFAYPGGFLYEFPSSSTVNPLQDGLLTELGGHIAVTPWKRFDTPLFNGLRLTPYGGAGEYLLMPVPAHRSSGGAVVKVGGGVEKVNGGAAEQVVGGRGVKNCAEGVESLKRASRMTFGSGSGAGGRRSVGSWLSGLARGYGGSVTYMA